jgi:hypothetical protein
MTNATTPQSADGKLTDLLIGIGYVLGVSYPVLALSTGVRSIYQLFFKEGVTDYLPPLLSGVAALCYLVATIGFFNRRRWAWRLSVGTLSIETLLTFIVGTLSLLIPDVIGRTVWRHFGADYGFFPLFQPLLGLAWLTWPETLRRYDLLPRGQSLAPGLAGWWQALRSLRR